MKPTPTITENPKGAQGQSPSKKEISVAFMGSVAPPLQQYKSIARNEAGALFQTNLIRALHNSDWADLEVFAAWPVPSYPHAPRVFWFPGRNDELFEGRPMTLLPFLNLRALKIATLGLYAAKALRAWSRRVPKGQPKVALIYNLTAPPAGPILRVCRTEGIRLVAIVADIFVPGEVIPNTFARRLEFRIQTRILPQADGLIVLNQSIVNDFAPGREALLIEGGVSEELLARFQSRQPKRSPQSFHAMFAGGLIAINGLDLVIDALPLIKDPRLRITIAGDGPMLGTLRAASASDPRLEVLGWIDHETVLNLYEQTDLVLNLRQTNSETQRYVFPSKVLECLATGRPLLTTATASIADRFSDFVTILQNETPAALAQTIEALAAQPPAARLAKAAKGQAWIAQHRTWPANVKEIEAYIRHHVLKSQ